jgi:hypothetical protein
MYINFKKVKFSCYALGKIMGYDREEKLTKKELQLLENLEKKEIPLTDEELECKTILRAQKKASENTLSKTAISYLIEEVFIYHKYGERIRPGGESLNESVTRIMKGTLAELSAIDLLSEYDGIKYRKNSKKFRNKWVSGYPDILHKKRLGDRKVTDIKSSWDLYTFMDNLPKNISLLNKSQVQGYIGLTKADVGEVCHVLVSSPDELIEKQIGKLRYKNVFATREELDLAIELTRKSMKFDDIPMEQRIIRFSVSRDEEEQKRMYDRVEFCRSWLMQYQQKHEEYFKKRLAL